ncbi:MAG TPA: YciI family protein [Longimicrobium sp.]|nr:YciI family protein [Longimicrobium sp.]
MRFMIIRKADPETEAGAMASEELIEAMAKYNEEMINAGVLLGGDGLQPASKGARIKFSNGRPIITDGPFTEAKEMIAGYTLIQVASREEALEWVKRWPTLDGHGNVELELRQLYELEDLGAGEGIEHHARLREQLAGR